MLTQPQLPTASPSEVVDALQALPMRTFGALASRAPDAPPTGPGFYAWWQTPGALPGITATRHPSAELELLYVGIGPQGAASRSNLRKRLAKHHRGAIGSSTFRFTLTAFLWEREGWKPYWTDRPILAANDLACLSRWQREHLSVQWFSIPEPWLIESEVIRMLRPPLNRDHNHHHPAYTTVGAAREVLREESQHANR